jgi:hypothetical protein
MCGKDNMFVYTVGYHSKSRKGYDFLNLQLGLDQLEVIKDGKMVAVSERPSVSYDRRAVKADERIRALLKKALEYFVEVGKAKKGQLIATSEGSTCRNMILKMWWPPQADNRPDHKDQIRTWGKIVAVQADLYPEGVTGLDMMVGYLDPRCRPEASGIKDVWVFDKEELSNDEAREAAYLASYTRMLPRYWEGSEGQERLKKCVAEIQAKMLWL